MVQSGLVDNPRVSQYRLAAHLALALLIYAAMLWIALGLLFSRDASPGSRPRGFAFALAGLVFAMAVSGSFVAGIRAGLAYNSFPLMNGYVVPPGMFVLDPWYLNFFANVATVQFDHRLIAWALAALAPWFWMRVRRAAVSRRARLAAHLLLGAVAVQIALGISTLLLAVPVPLAAAHQAGALLVFTAALFAAHALR
jgi:cytochrome c oxidase assembly protein subunit 15